MVLKRGDLSAFVVFFYELEVSTVGSKLAVPYPSPFRTRFLKRSGRENGSGEPPSIGVLGVVSAAEGPYAEVSLRMDGFKEVRRVEGEGGSRVIRWPEEFQPSRAKVYVRNELEMLARPERVWAWLTRARLWPTWYPNARKVRFVDGARDELALGVDFQWRTFGLAIASKVEEFEPFERLAWSARGLGVRAYHAWLIVETPSGCRVLTEETQNGFLATRSDKIMPSRLSEFHQIWLERLAMKAAGGPPAEDAGAKANPPGKGPAS